MQRIHKLLFINVLFVFIAVLMYNLRDLMNPMVSILRYLSLAYSMTSFGMLLSHIVLHKRGNIPFASGMLWLAIIILLFYSILTIDTFLFHAWTWYPGILRYALYAAYGICYIIFIPIGFILNIGIFHHKNRIESSR